MAERPLRTEGVLEDGKVSLVFQEGLIQLSYYVQQLQSQLSSRALDIRVGSCSPGDISILKENPSGTGPYLVVSSENLTVQLVEVQRLLR